jgi:hypothetical protein
MPRIFDNIEQPLLDALLDTIKVAHRADSAAFPAHHKRFDNILT